MPKWPDAGKSKTLFEFILLALSQLIDNVSWWSEAGTRLALAKRNRKLRSPGSRRKGQFMIFSGSLWLF